MKVIKNKAFRFLMFLIGYIGLVATVVFMFITVVSYAYLDGETVQGVPFAESPNVKDRINNTVYFINASVQSEKKVENIDLGDKKIGVYDINGSEKNKTISVKEFLASNHPEDALYYGFLNSTNSFYYDEGYDYFSRVAENPSGIFYKMSLNDYLSYIKEYGFKYDGRRMNKYIQKWNGEDSGDEEISGEVENVFEVNENSDEGVVVSASTYIDEDSQSDNNISLSDSYRTLSDEEYEMIYKKINKNISDDLYINDDDDIYVLYADNKIIIYNESC